MWWLIEDVFAYCICCGLLKMFLLIGYVAAYCGCGGLLRMWLNR